MKHSQKIAVVGGTGKSGTYLVKQLLNQGFQIKLLLRDPVKFRHSSPQVETVVGNVSNFQSIDTLLKDCSFVISTLGLGIPPSEPTIFAESTTHILRAMEKFGIKRYIVTTGLNVDTSEDVKSPANVAATNWMKQNYPISTANKQLEYELLLKSTIDWTLVRLPMIELTDERHQLNTSLEDCLGSKISATDLADFLINQLTDNNYIRKAPFISNH